VNNWQILGRVFKVEAKQAGARTIHRLTIVGEPLNEKCKPPCVAFDWWHENHPEEGQNVVASGTFSSWIGKDGEPRSEMRCDCLWPLFAVNADTAPRPAAQPRQSSRVADENVPPPAGDIPF
jgi:hypothetical protein